MKSFGLLFLLFSSIIIAAFIYLDCASKEIAVPNPGNIFLGSRKAMVASVKNRKLKEIINSDEAVNLGQMLLKDYRPVDPVPSSKASIHHGAISHGAPLLPFVPKVPPPPPSRPKRVGVP